MSFCLLLGEGEPAICQVDFYKAHYNRMEYNMCLFTTMRYSYVIISLSILNLQLDIYGHAWI